MRFCKFFFFPTLRLRAVVSVTTGRASVSVVPARAADKSVGSNEKSHIPTKTIHACPDASIPSISNTVASEPYIKSLY